MLMQARETTTARIKPDQLAALHGLAERKGRQVQALVDEALTDLMTKHGQEPLRAHVMAAYQESLEKYDFLYRKLAE